LCLFFLQGFGAMTKRDALKYFLLKMILSKNRMKSWPGYYDPSERIEKHLAPLIKQQAKKLFHEPDFAIYSKFIGDGIFLDVGANCGQSAVSFRNANQTFKILSIEPHPLNARLLEHVKRSLLTDFDYISAGVSDNVGELNLYTPVLDGIYVTPHSAMDRNLFDRPEIKQLLIQLSNNGKIEIHSSSIKTITIDSLMIQPDIIKIDTENHEFEVIKGARETILRSRPIFQVEKGSSDIFRFFSELEYTSFYYWKETNVLKREENSSAPTPNVFFIPNEKINLLISISVIE